MEVLPLFLEIECLWISGDIEVVMTREKYSSRGNGVGDEQTKQSVLGQPHQELEMKESKCGRMTTQVFSGIIGHL